MSNRDPSAINIMKPTFFVRFVHCLMNASDILGLFVCVYQYCGPVS